MSLILVAEHEGRYIERIRDALVSEGWRVKLVNGRAEALEAAAAEQPRLVLVNSQLDGSDALFRAFSRRMGGPGVVALVPETSVGVEAEELHADDVVSKPFTDQELRMVVRKRLAAGDRGASAGPKFSKRDQLSSADIFGDVLAEVETELTGDRPTPPPAGAERLEAPASSAAPPPSRPVPPAPAPPAEQPPRSVATRRSAELDRRLEETLSGLLDGGRKRPPAARAKKRRTGDADVDALLSETLSGLDLGARSKERAPRAPEQAPEQEPQQPLGELPPTSWETREEELDLPRPEELFGPDSAVSFDLKDEEPTVEPAARSADPPPAARPVEVPEPPPAVAAPASPAPSAPQAEGEEGQRFGQYTLLDRIAVGGMAEVWKARMSGVEGFQKTVAIKKILPHLTDNADFVSMFIDEAKLAAQLSHPNIIHIYDLGKIGDHFYIAMEYVEGTNLRALLNESRKKALPLSAPLSLLVSSRLASALDYAHRKKDFDGRELALVHRDVSPQNVLISDEGDIKLCDFGIVKAVSKASQTQMGSLKGKLQYMSPEQAWGKAVDSRSDIFSLGSILFEMLTGERLFSGDSEISVLEAVRQCRVRAPRQLNPEVPEEVEAIVLKALEQAPESRYQSAGQMQQEIEKVLYSLGPAPTQADLADYCRRLRSAPVSSGPSGPTGKVEPRPPVRPVPVEAEVGSSPEPSAPRPAAAVADAAAASSSAEVLSAAEPAGEALEAMSPPGEVEVEEGGSRGKGWLIIAILVLLALAVAAYFFLGRPRLGGDAEPAPAPANEETVPAPSALPAPSGEPSPTTADEGGEAAAAEPSGSEAPGPASPVPPAADRALPRGGEPSAVEAPRSQAGKAGGVGKASQDRPMRAEKAAGVESAEKARGSRLSEKLRAEKPRAEQGREPVVRPSNVPPSGATPTPPATGSLSAARPNVRPAARPTPSGASSPLAEDRAGEDGSGAPQGGSAVPPEGSGAQRPSVLPPVRGASTTGVEAQASSPGPAPPASVEQAETPPRPLPPGPAPEPSSPAPPQVKLGELVASGPGVVQPVLVSFDKPEYPPMARRMRVQGDVLISLLVDENGKVQDAKVITGVRQNVGINEAALAAARSARFRPATKNGVRVKMWTTLRIPFKL